MRTAAFAAIGLGAGVLAALLTRADAPNSAAPSPPPSQPAPPSETPSVRATPPDLPPVRLSVAERPVRDFDLWVLAIRRPMSVTTPPPDVTDCEKVYRWARRQKPDATQIMSQTMDVTLFANRPVKSRVLRITARVVGNTPKIPPLSIACVPPDRDQDWPLFDGHDLFLRNSVDFTDKPHGNPRMRPGMSWTYTVNVQVTHAEGAANYVLDVDYTLNGKRRSVTLDNGGRPFFITWGLGHMGYSPPSYEFVPTPRPRFTYRPAMCQTLPPPGKSVPCSPQPTL